MTAPKEFRAFLPDENDRIVSRVEFEAETFDAALSHAKQYVDGHDVEVWHSTMVIGRFSHLRKRDEQIDGA